jgi:hypothetical protein
MSPGSPVDSARTSRFRNTSLRKKRRLVAPAASGLKKLFLTKTSNRVEKGNMNNATSAQKKYCDNGVRSFRSELQSSVVGNASLKPSHFTGLRADGVKISEFRLEQYLNVCNPSCSG